ncbi:hypothetical protein GOV11_02390 [Candidatus Woesearchaeota archaeon]|nr:hypothetical protein [Candidatus Woesearchaeota archaeon]
MDREYVRVKIDLPSFQMDVKSKDPKVTLPELRKILESVRLDDQLIYEEFVSQELQAVFSDTFVTNQQVMTLVKRLLKQENDYRVFTADIPTTSAIDLDRNTHSVRVDSSAARLALSRIDGTITMGDVKHAIVHVLGDLDRETKVLIIDNIHQHIPTAQVRAFHTNASKGHVLVECIFFGEFPED